MDFRDKLIAEYIKDEIYDSTSLDYKDIDAFIDGTTLKVVMRDIVLEITLIGLTELKDCVSIALQALEKEMTKKDITDAILNKINYDRKN